MAQHKPDDAPAAEEEDSNSSECADCEEKEGTIGRLEEERDGLTQEIDELEDKVHAQYEKRIKTLHDKLEEHRDRKRERRATLKTTIDELKRIKKDPMPFPGEILPIVNAAIVTLTNMMIVQ